MRYFRLYGLVLAFIVLSVVWAWNKADLALNYTAVQGTVTLIDPMCHVEQGDPVAGRKTHAPVEMTCDKAIASVQAGQQFQGETVAFGTNIFYSYVSPIDHGVHRAKIWRNSEVDLGQPPLSVVVFASKTKAGVSKFVTR